MMWLSSPCGTLVDMSTYSIPEANLAGLQAKIAKLVKRAAKLNVPAPSLIVGEPVDSADEYGVVTRAFPVIVSGDAPHYDGWTLTAVIEMDHEEGRIDGGPGVPSPNVVGVVPGTPDEIVHMDVWRHLAERCDHCHVDNRRRNKLVVVTNESGEQMIVGSTCLKDFLGSTSPDAIASWASVLADLDDLVEGFEDRLPGQEHRYDPIVFLGWVVRAIAEFGWVSKAASSADREATAGVALMQMELAAGIRKAPMSERPEPLTEAEMAKATAAHEWAMGVGGNDYLDNVAAVAQKLSIRYKHLGIAASIITAFDRDGAKAIEREARVAADANSVFLGAPKEKIEFSGTVILRREFPGFGHYDPPTAMVKILTVEGSVIVWFASNASKAPEQGDVVSGSATVKEHALYEGVAQTKVIRAKLAVAEPGLAVAS